MQKIYCSIVSTVLLSWAIRTVGAAERSSDSFKSLSIKTVVNGKSIVDNVIVHDNDSCVFFLKDKNGNKFEPSEGEEIRYEWFVECKEVGGRNKQYKINKENDTNCLSFRVKPQMWEDMFFLNENIIADNTGYFGVSCHIKLRCELLVTTNDITHRFSYTKPVLFEVIPSTPVLELDNIYIDEIVGNITYYMVQITVNSLNNCKGGLLYLRNPLDGYKYGIGGFNISEPKTSISFNSGAIGDSYRFEAYNEYGSSASEFLTPDWNTVSVKDTKIDDVNIASRCGWLEISSDNPICNIKIFKPNGKICYNNEAPDANKIQINLEQGGLYILSLTKGNNKRITCKIFIK